MTVGREEQTELDQGPNINVVWRNRYSRWLPWAY